MYSMDGTCDQLLVSRMMCEIYFKAKVADITQSSSKEFYKPPTLTGLTDMGYIMTYIVPS